MSSVTEVFRACRAMCLQCHGPGVLRVARALATGFKNRSKIGYCLARQFPIIASNFQVPLISHFKDVAIVGRLASPLGRGGWGEARGKILGTGLPGASLGRVSGLLQIFKNFN